MFNTNSNGKEANCPFCRKSPFETKKSVFAQRMVNEMTVNCPNKCDSKILKSELKQHLTECPNAQIQQKDQNKMDIDKNEELKKEEENKALYPSPKQNNDQDIKENHDKDHVKPVKENNNNKDKVKLNKKKKRKKRKKKKDKMKESSSESESEESEESSSSSSSSSSSDESSSSSESESESESESDSTDSSSTDCDSSSCDSEQNVMRRKKKNKGKNRKKNNHSSINKYQNKRYNRRNKKAIKRRR